MPVEPLDSTLFISHCGSDVGLVAALVDFLEEAVPELEGAVLCSSLPGYTERGGNTRKHAALIALLVDDTQPSVLADVARALGRGTPTLVLRVHPEAALPGVLARADVLDMDRAGLSTLMEDVAFAFDVLPRLSDAGHAELTELLLAVHGLRDADRADGSPASPTPGTHVELAEPGRPDATGLRVLRSPGQTVPDTGGQPTPPIGRVASADAMSARVSGAVPQPPRAGALRCAEAGVALSECLYHDLPFDAFGQDVRARLQALYVALGGGSLQAVAAVDPESYQRGIDEVLAALPPERLYLSHWFEAGFQLALACNLGLCVAGAGVSMELAVARSEAWTAFAVAASELRIGPAPVAAVAAELARLLEAPARLQAQHRAAALQQLLDLARSHDEARAAARRQRALG